MFEKIAAYAQRPKLYEKSTSKFWDDEHISKMMLQAHLDPIWEAATRPHAFVERSVDWIALMLPPSQYNKLLDLGCGPGIYTEKFNKKSYTVTGIDFSERSINYAKQSALQQGLNIHYAYQNYLTISYQGEFDIATLIYCDFGVLSTEDRRLLLQKIHAALKPGGAFILDAFTKKFYADKPESRTWEVCQTGFWKAEPHLCLNSFYRYEEEQTFLRQTITMTATATECFNIWEHTFTPAELREDLISAGFVNVSLFADVAGAPFDADSELFCVMAKKM